MKHWLSICALCLMSALLGCVESGGLDFASDMKYAQDAVAVGGSVTHAGSKSAFFWGKTFVKAFDSGSRASEINAVIIVNGKVYAAGYDYENGKHSACYWVDGEKTSLGDGVKSSTAYGIAVSPAGDVYAAGLVETAGNNKNLNACYWVSNDAGIDLIDISSNNSTAYSIVLSGDDIHIAGHEVQGGGTAKAYYWKYNSADNTQTSKILLENDSHAYSVAVSGSTVYAAGVVEGANPKPAAYYWTITGGSATKTILSTDSAKTSIGYGIAVSGGDVFIVGCEGEDGDILTSCYWKNDASGKTTLGDGTFRSIAYGGAISGADVYAAGFEAEGADSRHIACYWKNGEKTVLSGGLYSSEVRAIAAY